MRQPLKRRPRRTSSFAPLALAALVLSSSLPLSGAAPQGPLLPVEVSVSIVDGTAVTEVRRTLVNTGETEAWFAVHQRFPAAALATRLAVLNAGTVVEEAEVASPSAQNATGAEGAWLAALPEEPAPEGSFLSTLALAVRVPAHDRSVLVVSWAQTLRAVRGAYRYALPLDGLTPSDAFFLNASVELASPIVSVQFSSPFNASPSGVGTRRVTLTASDVTLAPSRGFLFLNFTPQVTAGQGMVSYCLDSGGGTFSYAFFPASLDLALEPLPKSISFVIDFSGSMAGDKAAQAKAAFAGILEQLAPDDRFEVLRFDTKVVPLTSGLESASSTNISRAVSRINAQSAYGTTNLAAAINRSLTDLAEDPGSLPMVVLLTDGNPTVPPTDRETILALARTRNGAGASIHTLALGYEASIDILSALSADSRGSHRFIDPALDVVAQISDFYSEVSEPVIEDLNLTFFEPAFDVVVPPLSVLFKGSDITAHGRLRPFAGRVSIVIEGRTSKGQFSVTDSFVPSSLPCNRTDTPLALATVVSLIDRARADRADTSLAENITNLSLAHHFATPWTPFRLRSGASILTSPLPEPAAPPPPPRETSLPPDPGLLTLPAAVTALAALALLTAGLLLWRRARRPPGPRDDL